MSNSFPFRKFDPCTAAPTPSLDDLRTQRMWEGVPPDVFERAPSTVGKFERVETELIARLLIDQVALEGSTLHLLGCGTACREVEALLRARALEVERRLTVQFLDGDGDGGMCLVPRLKPIAEIIGYDFAAQFLDVAAERLAELSTLGVVVSARTEHRSLDAVELGSRQQGVALVGVYDMECLIGRCVDGEEPVGLEEYGRGMRDILGAHMLLTPLTVVGSALRDHPGGLYVRSDAAQFEGGFEAIRALLASMRAETPGCVGIRVRIQKEPFGPSGELAESCFTSTWFDLNRLASFLGDQHEMEVRIVRGESHKGAVLVLGAAHQMRGTFERCALMMNNVLGNLGSDGTLNAVVRRLAKFVGA